MNDFRKICGFEAYAPTDNVCELTARANDEGWDTCFAGWLEGSRIHDRDGVLVFSVGGGNREKNVSVNIVKALETATRAGAHIFGIVGRDGGFTRSSRRSLRGDSHGFSRPHHAAHRRPVRGGLAPARQSSVAAARAHQVGVAAMNFRRYFMAGGAGFIGSHFTDRLLADPRDSKR